MRGLYAIVDTDALSRRDLDPVAFAEALLAARPAAIQLRDKRGGARRTLALLRSIAPLARAAEVPLFANDRPDLAVLAGCDGVHVGQEDLPPWAAAAISDQRGSGVRVAQRGASLGQTGVALKIGVSTHTRDELSSALRALGERSIDYVAIGPVFATQSKERPDATIGLAGLEALVAVAASERPGLPVVAIGGITIQAAAQVGAICACAAVIAALLPAESARGADALADVTARARALHAALVGGAPP